LAVAGAPTDLWEWGPLVGRLRPGMVAAQQHLYRTRYRTAGGNVCGFELRAKSKASLGWPPADTGNGDGGHGLLFGS
jgi:hypothetical protein